MRKMKSPAPDLRVDRTLCKLKDALFSCIEENIGPSISVSALCRRSGISRSTFYEYFHSVQELLDFFTDRCIRELRKGINTYLIPGRTDFHGYYIWLLTYIRDNKQEFKCLYAFDYRTDFIRKSDIFCAEQKRGVLDKSRFCQYGANAILEKWLEDDCAEPIQAVAGFLANLVRSVQRT